MSKNRITGGLAVAAIVSASALLPFTTQANAAPATSAKTATAAATSASTTLAAPVVTFITGTTYRVNNPNGVPVTVVYSATGEPSWGGYTIQPGASADVQHVAPFTVTFSANGATNSATQVTPMESTPPTANLTVSTSCFPAGSFYYVVAGYQDGGVKRYGPIAATRTSQTAPYAFSTNGLVRAVATVFAADESILASYTTATLPASAPLTGTACSTPTPTPTPEPSKTPTPTPEPSKTPTNPMPSKTPTATNSAPTTTPSTTATPSQGATSAKPSGSSSSTSTAPKSPTSTTKASKLPTAPAKPTKDSSAKAGLPDTGGSSLQPAEVNTDAPWAVLGLGGAGVLAGVAIARHRKQ